MVAGARNDSGSAPNAVGPAGTLAPCRRLRHFAGLEHELARRQPQTNQQLTQRKFVLAGAASGSVGIDSLWTVVLVGEGRDSGALWRVVGPDLEVEVSFRLQVDRG